MPGFSSQVTILINNLVRTPDADAPTVPTTPNFDSGEYISESTLLKENAASLKLLIDVKRPNESAIITPKYRIVKENLRYLDKDSTVGVNILANQDLNDEFCTVYYLNNTVAVVDSFEQRGTVIVDGIDVDQDRIYLSSVSNPADFVDKSSISQDFIFITTEPDISESELSIWELGNAAVVGDYVINLTDMNLYVANINTSATPSPDSLDWTQLPIAYVDFPIAIDTEVEWRNMQQVGTINPAVDITDWVEYEYEPLISPSEEFDNFAIKIEMYSADEVNIPECKRLRVIAVN